MKLKEFRIFFLFAIICICAYMVRDAIYEQEKAAIGFEYERFLGKDIDFMPFPVESSMMYSYAEDVGCGNGIEEYDSSLVGMKGISVHKQFTTGLEYFLGYGYKIKNFILPSPKKARAPNEYEDNPDFAKWVKIQLRAWISLISGFIFLLLIAFRIPWKTAFFGGILHSVSTAAIARYTGQDIVRGNFALPLIMGTFLTAYWFLRKPTTRKLIITGIVAFLALATWDMTQICFAVWCLAETTRILAGGKANRKRKRLWVTLFVSVIFAAILIPYHREHLLILSPLVVLCLPIVIMLQLTAAGKNIRTRFANFAISFTACYVIWLIIAKTGIAGGNYGHFAELMKAKILFLNVKPTDPELLSFDARSIWVPAMHSANRYITKVFFPMMLHIAAISLFLSLIIKRIRKPFFRMMGIANFALFMSVFYSLGFFLIVRYHVFASLFLSILLPIILYLWLRNAKHLTIQDGIKSVAFVVIYFTVYNLYFDGELTPKAVILCAWPAIQGIIFTLVILALFAGYKIFIRKTKPPFFHYGKILIYSMAVYLLIFEIDALQNRRKYDRNFFSETASLIKWMRQERVNETILADFQLSPLLKAYTKSKIILQPKFELGKTRHNYKAFINLMFHGNENELAKFCTENGGRYFIYDKGYGNELSNSVYSARYIAAAPQLKKSCPAYMMNYRQHRAGLRNFHEIYPPQTLKLISNRYILFKVISEEDKRIAKDKAEEAEVFYNLGEMKRAATAARSAIFTDPNCPEAVIMYRNIFKKPPDIRLRGY